MLEKAGRRFGRRAALTDLSLTLEPGERVALLGPSGSGKSTLLRLLAGSLRSTSGRVLVDGRDLSRLSPSELQAHRSRLGLVVQGGQLVPQLSVHRNVVAGRLAEWSWLRTLLSLVVPLERQRTRALLDRVGLGDRQWDRSDILSGGQQQRVAIARALSSSPTAVLADEPTAALDPTTAADMVSLLLEVASERSATLVFCTHWVSLVRAQSHRILGIREGRLTLDKPAAEVSDADLDALYAGSRERR